MGMYVACQEKLIETLRAAGCEKQPFTSLKKMAVSSESRISAVLCEEETVEKQKGKKMYTDSDGRHRKRSLVYSRDITFTVVIGDYSNEKVEETYERFLRELPDGIYVDGNYVSIEPADTSWMGEKDHILYAKVSAQMKIVCHGGLYKDTDMIQLKDVDVDVRKEELNGRERNGRS